MDAKDLLLLAISRRLGIILNNQIALAGALSMLASREDEATYQAVKKVVDRMSARVIDHYSEVLTEGKDHDAHSGATN